MIDSVTTTDLHLRLAVPRAIRLHGLLTEHVRMQQNKLALLTELRASITSEPDLSEVMLAESIRDFERVQDDLGVLLYGDQR